MHVSQGDIAIVSVVLPGGKIKEHPVVVISSELMHVNEMAFIGVMITGN